MMRRQILVEDLEEKFEKVGLNKEYIRKLGSKLCKRHYKLLVEHAKHIKINLKSLHYLIDYLEKSVQYAK